MIEISNLTKKYHDDIAVDDISFTVQKGEIVGLLGPNGAGKSTAMNILTGYLSYTEGSVKIDGLEVVENPKAIKKRIGYLPEQPPLYPNMTVESYLKFVCALKKVKGNAKIILADTMERVNITDVKSRLIKNLSKGYKQRVGLAAAMIGDPEILILDEPTVGLDPVQIIEIRNLIKELGKDKTVILNSHILPEVSAICDRVIIINKGKIIASDTPANLAKLSGDDNKIKLTINGALDDVKLVMEKTDGVRSFEVLSFQEEQMVSEILVCSDEDNITAELFARCEEKGLMIRSVAPYEASLEDIFVKLVSAPAPSEEAPAEEDALFAEETADEPADDVPVQEPADDVPVQEPAAEETAESDLSADEPDENKEV